MQINTFVQDELLRAHMSTRQEEARLARQLRHAKLEQLRQAVKPSKIRVSVLGKFGNLKPAI